MIKTIVLCLFINTGELSPYYLPVSRIEFRRKRGKGNKGRKRGGSGLR